MHFVYFIAIILLTFIIMEGLTWLTHRYVMHGFLWYLHEDHHRKRPGFFEKNDAFFLLFAVPTIGLIFLGTYNENLWFLQPIGIGITLYGAAYFIVHDVIIHQRFKWFSRSNHTYVRAIRWAHKMHHKHLDRHKGESFGFLVVNKKYWDKILKDKKLMAGKATVEYEAVGE